MGWGNLLLRSARPRHSTPAAFSSFPPQLGFNGVGVYPPAEEVKRQGKKKLVDASPPASAICAVVTFYSVGGGGGSGRNSSENIAAPLFVAGSIHSSVDRSSVSHLSLT